MRTCTAQQLEVLFVHSYGGVILRPMFSTESLKHFVRSQIECIRTVCKADKKKTHYNKQSKKHLTSTF